MIEAIDKKYCHNGLVQLMHRSNTINLIISAEEILLLKLGDSVLINSYEEHPSRYLFPYSDKIKNGAYYNSLFEYKKPYLVFNASLGGYNFETHYFFEEKDIVLFYSESLPTDLRGINGSTTTLSREEIEKYFNKDNYDAMYIIETTGRILYANNKKNGLVIDNIIIPSKEEIIEKDYKDRINKIKSGILARKIVYSNDFDYEEKEVPSKIERRCIDEIKDLNLYSGGLLDSFGHMMLTCKDGNFSLKFFKIDMISKDEFKLTSQLVAIGIPTYNDVIKYMLKNKIEYTLEPRIIGKNYEEERNKENIEVSDNVSSETIEDLNKENEEIVEISKLLKKIFRKKRK